MLGGCIPPAEVAKMQVVEMRRMEDPVHNVTRIHTSAHNGDYGTAPVTISAGTVHLDTL
jgi:hypothetical protein